MTIENTDLLLVNRGSSSHQIKYEKVKTDIADSVDATPEAPADGKQYGRQDAGWTEIVHTPEYTDADVDAHLNTQTANANQVLSWSGTDYEWKESGSGGSGDPNLISYTYPSGQQRTLQKRLEDYVSIKDFGAVGYDPNDPNDTTDDTVAIRAAMNAVTSKSVYIPSGFYRISEHIEIASALTIFGDGMSSVLVYEPNVQDQIDQPCLKLRVDEGSFEAEDHFELHDIQVLKGPNNVSYCGVALIDGGDGAISGPFNKLILNNVTIGAFDHPDLGTRGYFEKGLILANTGGVVANNLTISNNIQGNHFDNSGGGRENPDSVGIEIFNNKSRPVIRQLMCTNFYIQDHYTALKVSGGGSIESIYMSHGEVKGRRGFILGGVFSASYLAGIHFDCWEGALEVLSGINHRIIGCDIRADDSQAFPGYLVQLNANNIVFANNLLDAAGEDGNGAKGGLIAINDSTPGEEARNITITDNILKGGGSYNYIALLVQTQGKNVTFGGNTLYQFGGNNQPWANLAGSELYIYGQRGYN